MNQLLYFAYGSNLDRRQMRVRCPRAEWEGRAVLRGYRLAFAGHSHRWGGPVATLVHDRRGRVQGVLCRLRQDELRVLDRYEGHPFTYRRSHRVVRDEGGRRRRAHVYVLDTNELAPPATRYFDVLLDAYRRLGFDRNHLVLAATGGAAWTRTRSPHLVFVYGTLLRGEPNHPLLDHVELVAEALTEPCYHLVDLGAFPAMVGGGDTSIAGELYAVDDSTLTALDQLEGHPKLYERSVIRLATGELVEAYLLRSEQVHGRPRIISGDWRRRTKEKLSCESRF